MNRAKGWKGWAGIGLGIALVAISEGCVGYADAGYDGGAVVVGGPYWDGGFWGGGPYEHGRDVHAYSHRGAFSRGVAHGGGGFRHR